MPADPQGDDAPGGQSRSDELTQNALNTVFRMDTHFKNLERRDTGFQRAKLKNFEYEMQRRERLNNLEQVANSDRQNIPASRATPHGVVRSRLPPGALSPKRLVGANRPSPDRLGRSRSSPNLAAARGSPQPPPAAPPSGQAPLGTAAAAAKPPRLSRMGSTGSIVQKEQSMRSASRFAQPSMQGGADSSSASATAELGGRARPPPLSRASSVGMLGNQSSIALEPYSPANPPLLREHCSLPDDEDLAFAAMEEDLAALHRPVVPESPRTIERLGELLALLGPRYKTIPWEVLRAKANDTLTPLQRRLRRQGPIPRPRLARVDPENLPSLDPDGKERGDWLFARQGLSSEPDLSVLGATF